MANSNPYTRSMMRLIIFASISTGLLATTNSAQALCNIGQLTVPCSVSTPCKTPDGRPGHHLCPVVSPLCANPCIADTPAPVHGVVIPNFVVIDVLYAPPGSANKNAKSPNAINYQTGGERDWTMSTSETFNDTNGVTVGFQIMKLPIVKDFLTAGGSASETKELSNSNTDTSGLEVKSTWTETSPIPGPPGDGINHDYDQIGLLLGPEFDVSVQINTVTLTLRSEGEPVFFGSDNLKERSLLWRVIEKYSIHIR
jgi:hypothetical protein